MKKLNAQRNTCHEEFKKENSMVFSALIFLIVLMFSAHNANAQRGDFINPLPQRTPETDREALRLMRNENLTLFCREPCVTIMWTCGFMSLVLEILIQWYNNLDRPPVI